MHTLAFYFSFIAFLISIGSGIYFLAWWIKSGKQYSLLLYWSYGLGTLLLFKIPNILANAKIEIAQKDFYLFFFVTLLAYFLAYFSLIRGFAFFKRFLHAKFIVGLCAIWFGTAIAYFASSFFIQKIGIAHAPIWIGHLLFYIPAQLFLLYALRRVIMQPLKTFVISDTVIALTVSGIISLLLSSMFYVIVQTGPYSETFWYFSVISSSKISFLQIMSGLLLFLGLRAFAKSYLRTIQQDSQSVS